jgi:hypothetical protein
VTAFVPLILHATCYGEYASSGLGGIASIGAFTMLFPCLLAVGRLFESILQVKSEHAGGGG